jgi:hypothetical protein
VRSARRAEEQLARGAAPYEGPPASSAAAVLVGEAPAVTILPGTASCAPGGGQPATQGDVSRFR